MRKKTSSKKHLTIAKLIELLNKCENKDSPICLTLSTSSGMLQCQFPDTPKTDIDCQLNHKGKPMYKLEVVTSESLEDLM